MACRERWNFCSPKTSQHLMTAVPKDDAYSFIEELVFGDYAEGRLDVSMHESGVWL